MITLRRARERHHDRSRGRDAWLTFFSEGRSNDRRSPLANGFGALEILDEAWLPPGASAGAHSPRDAQIVTFVRAGALAWGDSLGRSGLIQAGEFRGMTAGRQLRHHESNASPTDAVHFFQIWLRSAQADLEPGDEQKRFSAAQRRGRLCVVGSPDGRRGSLLIHQDAVVYTALLDPGTHVIHELPPGRSAWLHVVAGEAALGDLVLTTGDGAGFTAERAVSLTARLETEILLLDLCDEIPAQPVAASSRESPGASSGSGGASESSQHTETGKAQRRSRDRSHRRAEARARERGFRHALAGFRGLLRRNMGRGEPSASSPRALVSSMNCGRAAPARTSLR